LNDKLGSCSRRFYLGTQNCCVLSCRNILH